MTSPRRTFVLAAITAVAVLVACDIPTQAPTWDTTWQVPVNDDSIAVGQLLPGGITSTGVVFQVAVKPDSIARSLGVLCGAPCGAVHGTTAALPAFSATFSVADSIPAGVLQVTPAAGQTYAYQIRNNLSFDPLRPQVGINGMIVIGLKDPSNNVIGVDTLRGQALAFGIGTTLSRAMPLGSAPVSGPFLLAAQIVIPAGATVPIDTSSRLTITSTEDSVGISSARIVIDSVAITSFAREVDLSGLAGDVKSIVQGARVKIHLQNPMAVVGGVVLDFQDGIGNSIIPAKPFALATGASDQEVGLTLSEVKTLLDQGIVTMKVTGAVTGTLSSNSADVNPTDVAELRSRIFLDLRVNGDN
jgi:hypothetical protein